MHWTDEGVILSVRPHAETSAIVEVLTREHGRHLGLVYGGRSRKARPVLQMGNHVEINWRARLSEHLGTMTVEPRRSFATEAMESPDALTALMSLCALARLVPERDPHPNLYEVTLFVLGFLDDPTVWPALLVRWEVALLEELGFGMDLTACAATGSNDLLIYVSPKTGRAVSASAGEPYKDRLLPLPPFLAGRPQGGVPNADVLQGLALTRHFLETRVFLPRELSLPNPRQRLEAIIARF
ncbi:MAG: DNA repair protein RecO [Hyphomicrobiaceae bacterium]|nr:DNA repair protein RecO [Hyphomicrobiaceae bacterium]